MFSLQEAKSCRCLCLWRRTAKFISAAGLYKFPAGHGEPRTGLRRAAQGDGREQGHAECVVNTVRQRGLLCTRKFHVEGVDWALYSARARCCKSSRAKLVTSPTTIVVELHNQIHIRNNLSNLLHSRFENHYDVHVARRTKILSTLRNTTPPSSICLTECTRFLPARQHGQDKMLLREMSYLSLLFGPWGDNGESDLRCSEQVQLLWNSDERSYEDNPHWTEGYSKT